MEKGKFRLKDLKIGRWLKDKAPEILDLVDDYLPPVKVLTALVSDKVELPEADRLEYEKLLIDYEAELYRLEVMDRQSARQREVELSKSGKFDLMFYLTGIICLATFALVVVGIMYKNIPPDNKELFIHLVGLVEGAVLTIIAYYYGTSKSSNEKTKMLSK
jgi:hypothetical protein